MGCGTEVIEPDEGIIGSNFFPLQHGAYRVYDVQQIEYIFAGDNDTSNFQMKVVVADSFQNLEGGHSYLIEQYSRFDSTEQWAIDSVWSARKNSIQAIESTGNTPVIKLVFPLREGKTWDSNALNASEPDEYQMVDVLQAFYTKDSVEYSSTLTVVQEMEVDNILFEKLRTETYAEDIGMIASEWHDFIFCAEEGCIGLREIESGSKTSLNLIGHGQE